MDQNQNPPSLFGLNIDQASKGHLLEAARWGKFLAIVGFVLCALIVVLGIFWAQLMGSMGNRYGGAYDDVYAEPAMGVTMVVMFIIMALIYFFPCLFLYRFATKMRAALSSNDQETLNTSFQNLKATFRYVGVLTLIMLIIYGLAIIVMIASAGTM
jgi:hypothetical protein